MKKVTEMKKVNYKNQTHLFDKLILSVPFFNLYEIYNLYQGLREENQNFLRYFQN